MGLIKEEGVLLIPDRRKRPMKAEEFVKRVLDGERDFATISIIAGSDFNHIDGYREMLRYLREQDISKYPLILNGCEFKSVRAAGLYFPYAEAASINFDGALLVRPDFSFAKMGGSYLSMGAKLYFANFLCAELSHARISADLLNASLAFASLACADFGNSFFSGADLYKANLSRSNLRGALNLEDALNAETANFSGSRVSAEQKEFLSRVLTSETKVIIETEAVIGGKAAE